VQLKRLQFGELVVDDLVGQCAATPGGVHPHVGDRIGKIAAQNVGRAANAVISGPDR
jgi:hypothetical protein